MQDAGDGRRASVPQGDPTPLTVYLTASPDVRDSIAVTGALEDMFVGTRLVTLDDLRCDVLRQQLVGGPRVDLSIPTGLEEWFESMTRRSELDETAALLIVSMSNVLTSPVFRHKRHALLVQPPVDFQSSWTRAQRDWLEEEFQQDRGHPDDIRRALVDLVAHLEHLDASLLVFNVSTYTESGAVSPARPSEREPASIQAHRLNLMLDKLVGQIELYMLDVDRIAAELGAIDAVPAPATYSPEALDAIASEAAEVMENIPSMSASIGGNSMRIVVPRFDRRTTAGRLTAWHVEPSSTISPGDPLFDMRFENLSFRLGSQKKADGKTRSLDLSVVAGRQGYLQAIQCNEGDFIEVGMTIGEVLKDPEEEPSGLHHAGRFPVGIRLASSE